MDTREFLEATPLEHRDSYLQMSQHLLGQAKSFPHITLVRFFKPLDVTW